MTGTSATRQDVEAVLGEIDDLAIERVLATGASIDEISEALAGLDSEQRLGEPYMPSSPRVLEVRAVLDELSADDSFEDGYEETLHSALS